MVRLARWCFEHRRRVVAGWLLALVVVVGLSSSVGSSFNSDFNLPNTDSQAAVSLLTRNFPTASGENDQVVIQAEQGSSVRSGSVRSAALAALAEVAEVPGVETVGSPYGPAGAGQISRTGTVAFATVTWDEPASKVTSTDAKALITAAQSADSGTVHVSLAGPSVANEESAGPGLSVAVGVIAALVILLIVFGGALFASLMPLLAAVLALVIGTSLISLLTHAMSVADVSSDLAVLIGLGVGVDYGLFIISRHRSAVKAGLSYQDAAAQAVNTSGRTVLFAGLTVCIALLGQFALGVSFLYGLSLSSASAVTLTMATALTFLPAMLGFLGPKVLSRRERAALATNGAGPEDATRFWSRWATLVETRRTFAAVAALGIVVVIALPIIGLRLGSSDASTDPSGYTTHQADSALSAGFGPGFNGPLELVGRVSSATDVTAFDHFLKAAADTPGVASVTPAVTSPNGQVVLATLYPSSSPQTKQTVTLVNDLRQHVVPRSEQGTTLNVHVGGVTATDIDFSHVLADKLPLFIAVVVVLSFLLLTAVFRSLLIPLVASVMNLVSIGAGLGALNAVFNWGWGGSLLGLTGTAPIDAFIPVLMFSVLFGLSTDYEVYLVSRIQEEWAHRRRADDRQPSPRARATRHNHEAITVGQAKSGRIIVAAAVIMVLVFGSFLLNGERVLQEFGFGLGFSVFVDALLIRSVLVPAIVHLAGPSNWALPALLNPRHTEPVRRSRERADQRPRRPAVGRRPGPGRSPLAGGRRPAGRPRLGRTPLRIRPPAVRR
jgi:putative drug exporter of the RND superfamily